jgi:hypothetical protein
MKGSAEMLLTDQVSSFRKFLRRAAFGRVVLLAAIFSVMVSAAVAKPVTYTGFTITDGKLGSWKFHSARVYLTFQGDTNTVQFIQPLIDPAHPGFGTVDIWVNQTGKASVTIISGDKVVQADFADIQILVSLDLGDTPTNGSGPHVGARGVGFSSFTTSAGGETGFASSYPLGVEDGTIDWGDIVTGQTPPGVPSKALPELSLDLMHSVRFSGRAWPCVGFPNPCTAATPLQTDKGPLYLYLPYSQVDTNSGKTFCSGSTTGGASLTDLCDSLTAGFFIADVHESSESEGNQPRSPITTTSAKSANPITYYGYVISDVSLGEEYYRGAQVYLSFDADTSTVTPFSSTSPHGSKNLKGNAHVTIVSGPQTVSADFDAGQIYVYYDIAHASIGFGSTAGGTGYPLSITSNMDYNGVVEDSSVGAVSDLTLNHADKSLYTPATASLATDLRNATTLSGEASSCLGFDPTTSNCTSVSPIPLKTNRGNFFLYEPDRQDTGVGGQYSINWGVFWSEGGSQNDE